MSPKKSVNDIYQFIMRNKYSNKNKEDKGMKRNKSQSNVALEKQQFQASEDFIKRMNEAGPLTAQQRAAAQRQLQEKAMRVQQAQRQAAYQEQQRQARQGKSLDKSIVQKLYTQPTRYPVQAVGRLMETLPEGKNFAQRLAAARSNEEKDQLVQLFRREDRAGKELYKGANTLLASVSTDLKDKKTANGRDKLVQSAQLFQTLLGVPKTETQYIPAMTTLGDMFMNRNRTILQTPLKKKNYVRKIIQSILNDKGLTIPDVLGVQLRSILNALLTQKMAVSKLAASNPLNVAGVEYVPLQKKLVKAVDGLPGFGLDSRNYIFFDKYRYNQETKPTEQQLKQFAAAKSTLQLPSSHLQAYPQWLITRSAQIQQSKKLSKQSMKAVLQNEQNAAMSGLAAIDPNLATYNSTRQQWQGSAANILKSKLKNPQQFAKKYGQSNYLLQQKLTADQVTLQIPPIIKDIVEANDTLSKYGFGPVKPDGVGLYAGRWLDTVTGNLRVLPNASSKYLNPLDVNQKLGYLQARILNHWNNLINTAQQYNSLMINKDKYGQKVKNQLQNSLNPAKVKQLSAKTIDRTIDQYLIYKVFNQNEIQGGSNMNKYKAIILNRIQPSQLSQIRKSTNQKEKVTLWTRLVSRAYDTLQNDVNSLAGSNINAQVTLQSKLSSAYLSLVDTTIRKVKGALKKIMMIKTIPKNITQQNALQTVETINQGNQYLNQKLDPLSLDPTGVRTFMDNIRSTFLGKTEKQISQSLAVPAAVNKSTLGQFESWGPQNQLFKSADRNPWYGKIQTAKLSRNQTKSLQSQLFDRSNKSMGLIEDQQRWNPRVSEFRMQKPFQPLSEKLAQSRRAVVQVLAEA